MMIVGLTTLALRSSRWTALSACAVTACQLLQLFIATRTLAAGDYGLFAIILICIGFARDIADKGIISALVQKKDVSAEEVSSVFWLMLAIGVALAIGLSLLAPPIAEVYGDSRLVDLLRWASLGLLLTPFGKLTSASLQRSLRFDSTAKVEITSALVALLTLLVGALLHQGVLSLVFAMLSNQVAQALFYMFAVRSHWRPRLVFGFCYIKYYWRFWLYGAGQYSLTYLSERADQLLISFWLGPDVLGYYALAWNCTVDAMTRFNPILTRVCLPLFSRVQDDDARMKRGFLRGLSIQCMAAFPLLAGVAAVAPVAVPLIFGEGWRPTVIIIQVLTLTAAARSILFFSYAAVVIPKGRVDLPFRWTLISGSIQLPLLFVVVQVQSLPAVAAATSLFYLALLAWVCHFGIGPIVGRCFAECIQSIALPFALAVVMALCVSATSAALGTALLPNLILSILAGVLVYAGLAVLCFRKTLFDLKTSYALGSGNAR